MKSDVISDQTHYSFLRQCKKKKNRFIFGIRSKHNQSELSFEKKKKNDRETRRRVIINRHKGRKTQNNPQIFSTTMKKMQLYILPVEHRVIFPYETFRIRILETYQNNGKQ